MILRVIGAVIVNALVKRHQSRSDKPDTATEMPKPRDRGCHPLLWRNLPPCGAGLSVWMKWSDSCLLLSDRIWSTGRDLAVLGNGSSPVELPITLRTAFCGDSKIQRAQTNHINTHTDSHSYSYTVHKHTHNNKDGSPGP